MSQIKNKGLKPYPKIVQKIIDERSKEKVAVVKYAIAYTDNGSPPPHGKIIDWKLCNGNPWDKKDDALKACDLDGWRGYVCEYPSGKR